MALVALTTRLRPKHGAIVQMVFETDARGNVTRLDFRQQGYENHEIVCRVAQRQRTGGLTRFARATGAKDLVIPRAALDSLKLTTRGKRATDRKEIPANAVIPQFEAHLSVRLKRDFRGRAGQLAWLDEQYRRLIGRRNTLQVMPGPTADWALLAHQQSQYIDSLRIQLRQPPRPQMMADYTATNQVTWATAFADPGDQSGNVTTPSGADTGAVIYSYGGYYWTTGSPLFNAAAADEVVSEFSNNLNGSGILAIWGNPPAGSHAYAADHDGVNWDVGCIYFVTSADGTQITTTGFDVSANNAGSTQSVTQTTAVDDLHTVLFVEEGVNTFSPTNGTVAYQASNTISTASVYQKATGTSTTTNGTGFSGLAATCAGVVPTAAAAGFHPHFRTQPRPHIFVFPV